MRGFEIVAGDTAGILSAFTVNEERWRLKLIDETDILPRIGPEMVIISWFVVLR